MKMSELPPRCCKDNINDTKHKNYCPTIHTQFVRFFRTTLLKGSWRSMETKLLGTRERATLMEVAGFGLIFELPTTAETSRITDAAATVWTIDAGRGRISDQKEYMQIHVHGTQTTLDASIRTAAITRRTRKRSEKSFYSND